MAITIPLIRAANILPLVRWMETNRYDADAYLQGADLAYWYALSPLDPVPTINAVGLIGDLARDLGPDVGIRIVTEASLAELGFIGKVALGARTPAESLIRISQAIPHHSSHEFMHIDENDTQVTITELLHLKADQNDLHAVHVLFCALIQQLCKFTGMQPPLLSGIEMVGHSEYGVSQLQKLFDCPIHQGRTQAVSVAVKATVAHNPFRMVARNRLVQLSGQQIPPLTEDQSLSASVRSVIVSMLYGGEPTIERVSRAAGTSIRTLQRRLNAEGTSFSAELDQVRRHVALERFGGADISLQELTERLGYSTQSALSRAIRRLTGRTPTQLMR